MFRGYATTAAAREGHDLVLNLLQRAGAQQPALEDALLEACLFGQGKSVELLISSDMTRPEVLAQALLYASSRGFVDIVAILIKVNQKTPALINLKPTTKFYYEDTEQQQMSDLRVPNL
jgi:ankyrin repeat protein